MATTTRPARRPTIADIPARAGLTKAAVSFALNDQSGLSPATRAIARETGWQPNSAAQVLTDGRAGAFGLVIDRPAVVVGPPEGSGPLTAVFTDERANARVIAAHFSEFGHGRIGHVAGMADLWHTRLRARALIELAAGGDPGHRREPPGTPAERESTGESERG